MAEAAIQFNPEEMRLLYRVAQTLLHEQEYGELLADLLDATIEGLGAERGFVVVREGGKFRATVARNFRSSAGRGQLLRVHLCPGRRAAHGGGGFASGLPAAARNLAAATSPECTRPGTR